MKTAFTELLGEVANLLGKYIHPPAKGTLTWDGTKYAAIAPNPFDPGAGIWWGIISAMAGLLQSQDGPLSAEQKAYVERLLFGGMGSFNDFSLDAETLGSEAREANESLDTLRNALFKQFRQL